MSSDPERMQRDAAIAGEAASATATGLSTGLTISTPFWLYWLDIALGELAGANAARFAGMRAQRAGGEVGFAIVRETRAGMIAAVASAACIESFAKTAAAITPPVPARRPSTAATVLDILMDRFTLDAAKKVKPDLKKLFDDRNTAIHSAEETNSPEPHPLGTQTGSGNAYFTRELAAEAVCLATNLLVQCVGSVKPGARFVPLSEKLARHRELLEERAAVVRDLGGPDWLRGVPRLVLEGT